MRTRFQHPLLVCAAGIAVLLLLVAVTARREDLSGGAVLHVAAPAVAVASAGGRWLIAQVRFLVFAAAAAIVIFAATASLVLHRSGASWFSSSPLLVLATATIAQLALLSEWLWTAAAMIAAAAVASAYRARFEQLERGESFDAGDARNLLLLVCWAALLRFYALNRIPASFEGELAPYYLGATTLSGVPLANAGAGGPWAPLGFLFYVPFFLAVKFFGPTLLAIRFSAAVVSLLTLGLLYCFALVGFGRVAAVSTSIFFILDPLQIGWGRTDVHPHGFTTWPTLLICLASVRAYTTGRLRWFALLALLMGLSWHQYPSGQAAVFIPVVVFAALLIRGEKVQHVVAKGLLLLSGVTLWLAGAGLAALSSPRPRALSDYFVRLGTRVLWNRDQSTGSAGDLLWHATGFASDIVAGLFVRLRYVFHQDIFVPIPDLPSRSISWVVAALVLAGLCLSLTRRTRSKSELILLAWMLVSIMPAVFSDRAYPKRSATLFPALFVLAGATASEVWSAIRVRTALRRAAVAMVVPASIAWTCATCYLWFSGSHFPNGRNNETIVSEQVIDGLTPGTLVVANLWHGYGPGKLTYLLSGALGERARQPIFWYVVDENRDLRALLQNPRLAIEYAQPDAFYYRWADLSWLVSQGREQQRWKQVVFVLQLGLDTPDKLGLVRSGAPFQEGDSERLALLHQSYPNCDMRLTPPIDCNDCGFMVARCPLSAY